jgi:Homeodomain-like domain
LTSAAPSHGKMMTHARRAWHGWAMEVVLWSTVTVAGTEIALRLHVSAEAVSRIRRPFPDTGVAGLATGPKTGRKDHTVPAATVERLVELALSPPPDARRRWTTRLLAQEVDSHQRGVCPTCCAATGSSGRGCARTKR